MKERFGGLMCLLLGSVLIAGGGLGLTDAGGGSQPLSCGTNFAVGIVVPSCPMGTISITETTSGDATPPSDWTVTITSSNCRFPGDATSMVVTVPDDGTMASGSLYQNTSGVDSSACSYSLAETAVAGFTATFTPSGPYTLPQQDSDSSLSVALANVSAITPTPTPTPTATPTPSRTPAPVITGTVVNPGNGGGGGTLPFTGSPHAGLELGLGGGLVVLGLVLLLAGRTTRSDSATR